MHTHEIRELDAGELTSVAGGNFTPFKPSPEPEIPPKPGVFPLPSPSPTPHIVVV